MSARQTPTSPSPTKERWDIELLFKWLKQNLKIRCFLGHSENCVRIQIYVALIAFLLLHILHHSAGRSFKDSTALLLTRLKRGLFGPFSLCQHATPPPRPALRPPNPQTWLSPGRRSDKWRKGFLHTLFCGNKG
jgi:putative transposase